MFAFHLFAGEASDNVAVGLHSISAGLRHPNRHRSRGPSPLIPWSMWETLGVIPESVDGCGMYEAVVDNARTAKPLVVKMHRHATCDHHTGQPLPNCPTPLLLFSKSSQTNIGSRLIQMIGKVAQISENGGCRGYCTYIWRPGPGWHIQGLHRPLHSDIRRASTRS
jgi:hypothetical protein